MDQHYYFIVGPTGDEDGPFILAEIARKLADGTVSQEASLLRVGETRSTPIRDVATVLAALPLPPPRRPQATLPPIPVHVEPAGSAPVALQPYVPPPPVPPRRANARWPIAAGIAALALGGLAYAGLRGGKSQRIEDAMVRVSTPTGTGAGFLIDGPDDAIYVATANHVVDRGERVLVERDVDISDKRHFVEAYPETEIVAADPDADLAIIRIKNVEASRFHRLHLAKEPLKDQKISSYGYPGSNLAKHAGLVSKDGKVLSLVMFPAYDERYARIVRENAVDGLLISTDIEPGFSGGPTTNEAGDVVGVNVTKDHAHVGQNGAVSVVALRGLLAKVQPAAAKVDPKPEDIVALLGKIQNEYLLLPVDERSRVRENEFLNAGDLPTLRTFVGEIRREEHNGDAAGFYAKQHLSGQAALGMYFARLPGRLLETYRAPSILEAITACDITNRRLAGFLGELGSEERHALANLAACDELALRPLAWDLAAATLQWDGHERQYTVTKLDRMDDEGNTFRASVRISGAANLVELWIGMDRGMPRLKLFDPTGNLYAIKSPRNVSASALQGTWTMKRPRVTDAIDKDAEVEGEETINISIGDEHKVQIRHALTQKFFQVGRKSGAFACDHKATIETGVVQSFAGTLENGVVVALPEKESEPTGADAGSCISTHRADRIVAVKLVGDQLTMYRTDGLGFPETVQFAKQ